MLIDLFFTRTEWYCSACRATLGTGPSKPALVNCPRCGAHFTNGLIPSRNTNVDNPPTPSPAPASPAPATSEDLRAAGNAVRGATVAVAVGLIAFGVLVLGTVGFLAVSSFREGSSAPPRRRRPRD
jgi:hypothetical protein